MERLAKHHGLTFEDARRAFTKEEHGRKYAMRRKKDTVYGRICRFFDTKKRRCTDLLRRAPPCAARSRAAGRCGYYDFLSFERRAQEDDEFVALTNHED